MLIFGHDLIPSAHFYHITEIDAIASTPPNTPLFLHFEKENLDIIRHLQTNDLDFALEVASLKDAIFAENLRARYIVTDESLAKTVQNCAEQYLFDAKILCRIESDEKIETCALEGIDGVIYPEAIIKI